MALYGIDFYGASRYGPRVYLNYDANPMRARSSGYGVLDVSWSSPTGDWSILRLVRSAYGVPISQDDGATVLESRSGSAEPLATRVAPTNSYRDVNLTGGKFYYYAVWLYVPSLDQWTRAAYTTGLAVGDYRYSDRLWELTPSIYRTTSGALLDADNTTLQNYLRVVGFQLDHIRAEYDTLRDVNDPLKVSGNLLPLMAQQYGQFFEPEIGMKQMRGLLQKTVYLYRNRGTVPGIEGFVKAVTGYGAKIQPLKNLILDYNDSSFEESIGRWYSPSSTLTRYLSDDVIAAPELYQGMRRVGLLRAVSTANAFVLQNLSGTQSARDLAIPVTGGSAYTFSAYSRAGTTARGVLVEVWWYSDAGYISASAGTAVTNATATWTRSTVSATAPASATRAVLAIRVPTSAVGEVHYFDALQFEAGSSATAYEDARLLDINVIAPRINHVLNPNFESGTANWASSSNATLAVTTTHRVGGTQSLMVTAPAASTVSRVRTATGVSGMKITGATEYTLSFSIRADVAGHGIVVYLTWYRADGTATVPANTGTSVLPGVVVPTDRWLRHSITATSPADAAFATISLGIATNVVLNEVWYLDNVMLEATPVVREYFDGTTYAFVGDSIWEGTANGSRSHYYPLRRTKNYRVSALLTDYTPMGSSYRLNYAQPL